jgi:flagellar biosynthesis protein FlhG
MAAISDQASSLRELVAAAQREASPETPRAPGGKRARVLAVTSGKGGVGKTTIAVNLAVKLSQMGRRIVLIDVDLGTANADVLCNMAPTDTLAHVVAGRLQLRDALVEAPGGFRMVVGASGLAQMAALNEFERHRLLDQIGSLRHDADMILIDTGAGVGPNVLHFAAAADQVLVVATPEPTSITDAYAVIKTIVRRREGAEIALLVNMARDEAEARSVFDRLSTCCRRFLRLTPRFAGHVLHDARVTASIRRRRPFVIDAPTCDASAAIAQLAHRMDRHAAEPRSGGLLRRMATWLGA